MRGKARAVVADGDEIDQNVVGCGKAGSWMRQGQDARGQRARVSLRCAAGG
ncbi:hypothetical protein A6302_02108 [Methylobrevis pamukkalensis]|uniref:Uncharacterized protein n=1 Tax=Methylobrevis pamukkalensis TaxID=1439726 RepID=A0A1E3H457_9HYPH|nr:hypothetical protein A6302_02108 [Methylobrevis pamukkalensis]